jgi:hypothetical protein
MTSSDAGSFRSILFPNMPAAQRHRDNPISEQAHVCVDRSLTRWTLHDANTLSDRSHPLQIDDAFSIVMFTQQFRYVGAISSSSLSDDDNIAKRLRSAAHAFGCLRKWMFGQSFGSRSLPLVSKGKLYSTLVLNLLLYGCENWVLTAPLRQRLNTFRNRCVRAMARPQRTSFSSTDDHPAPFVKRPALAPMYTALGLTSLDLVISNRKLRWSGRDAWTGRGSLASSSRHGSTHLAAEDGQTPTGTTSRASSS